MSLETAMAAGRVMSRRCKRRAFSVCAGFALTAGLLAGASPALGAYPGQNGKFVYEQGPCPDCGLVLVDRNGSTRLTTSGVIGPPGAQIDRDDQFGVISPDGEWIAFMRREFKHNFNEGTGVPHPGLYVMRTDGSELRMLVETSLASSETARPTWSRDGTKIAYSNYPDKGELTILDATGPPNPRVVPATAGGTNLKVASVVWSPTDDVF